MRPPFIYHRKWRRKVTSRTDRRKVCLLASKADTAKHLQANRLYFDQHALEALAVTQWSDLHKEICVTILHSLNFSYSALGRISSYIAAV